LALSLDLKKTLALAVRRIATYMRAEAASMFLVEPDSGLWFGRTCFGPVDITGLKLEVGQGCGRRTVAENARRSCSTRSATSV